MAAPTNPAHVKKVLANGEPSTHGTKRTFGIIVANVRYAVKSGHPPTLGRYVHRADLGADFDVDVDVEIEPEVDHSLG